MYEANVKKKTRNETENTSSGVICCDDVIASFEENQFYTNDDEKACVPQLRFSIINPPNVFVIISRDRQFFSDI